MIEQSGKVVLVDAEYAWVQTLRRSACSTCSAKSTCGTSVLDKLSSGKVSQTPVKNTLQCNVGDEVVIGIPDDALVTSALLVYLVPLVTLFLGAVLAEYVVNASEGWTIAAALSGLMTGFGLVRLFSRSSNIIQSTQPVMIRRIQCIEVANVSPESPAITNL